MRQTIYNTSILIIMGVIKFTKMHGIGNDYIYINCLNGSPDDPAKLAIAMSPRHTSVGSDGIILIMPSESADFKMRIFNADGSEARMCGNGSRCVGKYVYDNRITDKTEITLETLSGVKHLKMHVCPECGKVDSVTVDMGKPSFKCSEIPAISATEEFIDSTVMAGCQTFTLTAVSMGNPHGVIFTDTPVSELDLLSVGPLLECHQMWPDKANIEFINLIDSHNIIMKVWERGSGETMACGTGACASATAAVRTGKAAWPITVHLAGGNLMIDMNSKGHILMTGPAVEVFQGTYINPSGPDLG